MSDAIVGVQARIAEIQRLVNASATARATSTPAASQTTATATDFAAVLAQATNATSNVDLSTYGNGRIPPNLLTPLGDSDHRLAAPADEAFLKMRGDAAAAGVKMGINDSYRSYEEQVEMARTKGIYGQGGLAAVPGKSDHGRGISVDLELNATAQQWMKNNAGRYGYVNDVRGEPWHWTHKP